VDFTKHGFFNAVCARQGTGQHSEPVDQNRIMVRARLRSHLEALQAHFPERLGEHEIRLFPGTDYAYRLFVPKNLWAEVVSKLVEETDYDNFKDEVKHHQGKTGAAYEHALHEVWHVMNRLQK